ncbi:hypothetical protein SAMN02910370_02094 [Lachnospiraceae bacterium XPB1003]|nr:hypothetical protein SAMN02910370_02094 [Lachnospiraceae bacterium XPB1003]
MRSAYKNRIIRFYKESATLRTEVTNIDNTVMLPNFVEPNGEDEAGEKEIKFNRVADLERNITTDIVLPYKKLKHYFPDDWTEKEKKDLIFALLDNWLVQEKYKT